MPQPVAVAENCAGRGAFRTYRLRGSRALVLISNCLTASRHRTVKRLSLRTHRQKSRLQRSVIRSKTGGGKNRTD